MWLNQCSRWRMRSVASQINVSENKILRNLSSNRYLLVRETEISRRKGNVSLTVQETFSTETLFANVKNIKPVYAYYLIMLHLDISVCILPIEAPESSCHHTSEWKGSNSWLKMEKNRKWIWGYGSLSLSRCGEEVGSCVRVRNTE